MINWTEVIIACIGIVITGILIPVAKAFYNKVKTEIDTNLEENQRQLIYEIVEVFVRWAKQWLQDETGEFKKQEVLKKCVEYLNKIGIDVDVEYLDCLIEAIYEQVKNETVIQSK